MGIASKSIEANMKNTIEQRFFINELRSVDEENKKKISGYAAVFNRLSDDLGGFREKIIPGAFSKALSENQDVIANLEHDNRMIIGRSTSGTLRMAQDEHGLKIETDLPDTVIGRDAYTLVQRGDLNAMSFKFSIDDGDDIWEMSDNMPIRTLMRIPRLYDVSIVSTPAYPDTSAAARSLEVWANSKQIVYQPNLYSKKLFLIMNG